VSRRDLGRYRWSLTAAAALLCSIPAGADETDPEQEVSARPNAQFTAALLQFFDPSSSSLAEPLTYLWGQQLYHSISDLKGARITRVLQGGQTRADSGKLISTVVGSHDVAAAVARDAAAQMTIWGVLVNLNRTNITLAASLTAPTRAPLFANGDKTPSADWRALPASAFMSEIGVVPPTIGVERINFAPMSRSLKALYGDQATVRCFQDEGCPAGSLFIYERPSTTSHGTKIAEGETLLLDLDTGGRLPSGKFVPVVRTTDQQRGWVQSIYLDIAPHEIFVSSRVKVFGRRRPAGTHYSDTAIKGPKFFEVLDNDTTGAPRSATRWYQIQISPFKSVWLDQTEARAAWPANHINFIAGLYRYTLHEYDAAYDEFALFTFRADQKEDNVAMSLAYQFMAACALQNSTKPLSDRRKEAIALLDQAVLLTPYDDGVLINRAYVKLGWNESSTLNSSDLASIENDISKARTISGKLDQDDPKLRTLELLSLAASTPFRGVDFFRAMLQLPRCNASYGTLTIEPVKDASSARLSEGLPPNFLSALATQSRCFKVVDARVEGSLGDQSAPSTSNDSDLNANLVLQPRLDATTASPTDNGNKGPAPKVEMAVASFTLESGSSNRQVAWALGTSRAASQSSKESGLSPVGSQGSADPVSNSNGELATKAYLDAYTKLLKKVMGGAVQHDDKM